MMSQKHSTQIIHAHSNSIVHVKELPIYAMTITL